MQGSILVLNLPVVSFHQSGSSGACVSLVGAVGAGVLSLGCGLWGFINCAASQRVPPMPRWVL